LLLSDPKTQSHHNVSDIEPPRNSKKVI